MNIGGLNTVLDKISNSDTGVKIVTVRHERDRPDIPLNMTLLHLELEVFYFYLKLSAK